MLHKLFRRLRVKLLMLNDPDLQSSEILVALLCNIGLLLFLQSIFGVLMMNIFIFNLNDILLILVDNAQ